MLPPRRATRRLSLDTARGVPVLCGAVAAHRLRRKYATTSRIDRRGLGTRRSRTRLRRGAGGADAARDRRAATLRRAAARRPDPLTLARRAAPAARGEQALRFARLGGGRCDPPRPTALRPGRRP